MYASETWYGGGWAYQRSVDCNVGLVTVMWHNILPTYPLPYNPPQLLAVLHLCNNIFHKLEILFNYQANSTYSVKMDLTIGFAMLLHNSSWNLNVWFCQSQFRDWASHSNFMAEHKEALGQTLFNLNFVKIALLMFCTYTACCMSI